MSFHRLFGHHCAKVVCLQFFLCFNIVFFLLSKLVSTFHSEPSCVVVSPDGRLIAVGTGEGTIHFLHTETGQVTVKHEKWKLSDF